MEVGSEVVSVVGDCFKRCEHRRMLVQDGPQ
jgi:hypothetical protein